MDDFMGVLWLVLAMIAACFDGAAGAIACAVCVFMFWMYLSRG